MDIKRPILSRRKGGRNNQNDHPERQTNAATLPPGTDWIPGAARYQAPSGPGDHRFLGRTIGASHSPTTDPHSGIASAPRPRRHRPGARPPIRPGRHERMSPVRHSRRSSQGVSHHRRSGSAPSPLGSNEYKEVERATATEERCELTCATVVPALHDPATTSSSGRYGPRWLRYHRCLQA